MCIILRLKLLTILFCNLNMTRLLPLIILVVPSDRQAQNTTLNNPGGAT